uniref:Uncharacterized protein n=1 Tax=Arundo donax TaxID=35708 RepID=A0A0A9GEZ2_ARUDO
MAANLVPIASLESPFLSPGLCPGQIPSMTISFALVTVTLWFSWLLKDNVQETCPGLLAEILVTMT